MALRQEAEGRRQELGVPNESEKRYISHQFVSAVKIRF